MKNAGVISVEVAYACPKEQVIVELTLTDGTTTANAIEISGLLKHHPEIDLEIHKIGVFGKPVGLEYIVRNQDRVEIYRPLSMDPKEARRRRAAAAKRIAKRVGCS